MKLNKLLLGLVACASLVSVTSCGTTASGGNLEKILEKKTLFVGTNAEYAPFEYMAGGDSKIYGYDTKVVSLIEESLEDKYNIDLTVKYSNMPFNGLLGAMTSNTIDIIVAAFSITDERKESVAFTDVYYQAKTVIVTKSTNTTITDYESLKNCKLGAQLGTLQADFGADAGKTCTSLDSLSTLLLSLENNNIDAIIVEKPVAETMVASHSDLKIIDSITFDDDGGYGIATNFGCEALIAEINTIIAANKENGKLDSLFVEACNEYSAAN